MKETDVHNATAFQNWFLCAAPSDRCVYHRGHLAADTSKQFSSLNEKDRLKLTALGNLVWGLQCRGGVLLTQRREGEVFAYLATATSVHRPQITPALALEEAA